METLSGIEVLKKFDNEYSLLSSTLCSINIDTNEHEELAIEMIFKLTYPANLKIGLKFIGVKEFSFYHSMDHYFYYVESCKFLFDSENFYLSLDPFDQSNLKHENDNDFIVAEKVSQFFPVV